MGTHPIFESDFDCLTEGESMSQIAMLPQGSTREQGSKVQVGNIQATKHVADIIRTCLGPRSMYKMLMDPQGGIVVTNDGNAILREIMVKHPAAKSMIEISRTQDEECGDGTTSVIILAGEVMSTAQEFLEDNMHPTKIIAAYRRALDDIEEFLITYARTIDPNDDAEMKKMVQSSLGTKFISRWMDLACEMAIKAVRTVHMERDGRTEIDIKRFAKVEKIPGGSIEDSMVPDGVMMNKDVTHSKMARKVVNPRILLLDCGLEYTKGESQTDMELSKETDFARILELEEQYIRTMCDDIIALNPSVVITEKGVSDLAQHFLAKAGISAIRRVSKDVLMEVERNLQDAMQIARNIMIESKVVPGGGACELAVANHLTNRAKLIQGEEQFPYKAIARALEVIPRTLSQNCGANTIRTLTELRAKHTTEQGRTMGVDGTTGKIVDMNDLGVWEPLSVKLQVFKTAIETATLLLRIDDIVSGTKRADGQEGIGAVGAD